MITRTESKWVACLECADRAFSSEDIVFPDPENDTYEFESADIPHGVDWKFAGNSTFRCPHLTPSRGRQGAGDFKGKFTRKTLGYRSLHDQESGQGSNAYSKMSDRYKP